VAIDDHAKIGTVLASYERTFTNRAAHHEAEAERARNRKKAELAKHVRIPDEHRKRLEARYDTEIGHHEREGVKYRRRAEFARAGFVLDSPDEQRDADFRREHGELIKLAERAGRLYYSSELAASQAGLGTSAADFQAAGARFNENRNATWDSA
jgi:hypothetical protein